MAFSVEPLGPITAPACSFETTRLTVAEARFAGAASPPGSRERLEFGSILSREVRWSTIVREESRERAD